MNQTTAKKYNEKAVALKEEEEEKQIIKVVEKG